MTREEIEEMVAPAQYQVARAEKRAAYERYNYAGVALELAQIKERFAEIKSQYEPLEKIANADIDERKKLYAVAFYVVLGRFPENTEAHE